MEKIVGSIETELMQKHGGVSIEFGMYDIRVFMPVIDVDPHLDEKSQRGLQ